MSNRIVRAGRELFKATTPVKGATISSRNIYEYRLYDENPDPLLQAKGEGLELFDLMMQDDHISGIMALKKRLALSMDWVIREASSDPKDLEIAEFVRESLTYLDFPEFKGARRQPQVPSFLCVLDNLLDARTYGFKVAVPRWIADGGKWRYKSIICKPSYQIQFQTNEADELEYLYVGDPGLTAVDKDKQIDPSSVIIFTWPYVIDSNWYGQSELSQIYREFFAKSHTLKMRNMHTQNHGSPTVVAEIRSDLSDAQIVACRTTLENWQDRLILEIPSDWNSETNEYVPHAKVSFLEAQHTTPGQYIEINDADNRSISRKLLVPDMAGFTDVKFGSRALGESQFSNVITLDTRYTRGLLRRLVNAQIIWPLTYYNYGDVVPPTFEIAGDGEGFTKLKAEALEVGKRAGIVKPAESWVRPWAGLPEPEEIEEEEEEPVVPPVPPAPAPTGEPAEQPTEEPDEEPVAKQKMAASGRFNAKQARQWYDEIEEAAVPIVTQAIAEIGHAATDQAVRNGAMEGDWKKIEDLKAPGVWKQQLRTAYEIVMGRMYFNGRLAAHQELKKARPDVFTVPLEWPTWAQTDQFLDRKWLDKWMTTHGMTLSAADKAAVSYVRNYSFRMAGVDSQHIVDRVGTIIYTNAPNMMMKEVVALIDAQIAGKAKASAQLIVRNNASTAMNNGRMQTYQDAGDLVQGYEYDAILDEITSPFCVEQDGRYVKEDNPMFARIQPPNHDGCRSIFVAVLQGETPPSKEWRTGLLPSKRFGG